MYHLQTGGFLYLFPRGAGIGSEEVVTLITQQKEQRSSNDNGKKPTKRGLGEDVIYVYWHFDTATTIDNWTLHTMYMIYI